MPSDEPRSPRAEIQNWLVRTGIASEGGDVPGQHDESRAPHRERESQRNSSRKEHDHGDGRRGKPGKPPRDVEKSLWSAKSRPNPGETASDLGLAAPFRSFGQDSHAVDGWENVKSPVRKRRQRYSSSSSYLETAKAMEHREEGVTAHKKQNRLQLNRRGPKPGDDAPQPSRSVQSSGLGGRPEKPPKSYERRPRHKTREDCYSLKQSKPVHQTEIQADKGKPGSRKKPARRRKEKSGTALMHEFTAQNVAQDRLTLRSAPKLGLFAKGRASSPFRRRGLPDLAFSEMAFLNARKADILDKAEEKRLGRNRDKHGDAGAERSRYFMSKKSSNYQKDDEPARESPHPNLCSKEVRRKSPRRDDPSLSLAGLPENPFIGFGSSGGPITSPATKCQMVSTPNPVTRSQSQNPASTRSTNYYSWSRTGSYASNSLQPHSSHSVPSRSSAHCPRRALPVSDEPLGQQDEGSIKLRQNCNNDQLNSKDGASNSGNQEPASGNKKENPQSQIVEAPRCEQNFRCLSKKNTNTSPLSSDKDKTKAFIDAAVVKCPPVDGERTADNSSLPTPGPYGLSVRMPLASFDTVLESLIVGGNGSIPLPPHYTPRESGTLDELPGREQKAGSSKHPSAGKPVQRGVPIAESEKDQDWSGDLTSTHTAPPSLTIHMNQARGHAIDKSTISSGPSSASLSLGRGSATHADPFHGSISSRPGGSKGNKGSNRVASAVQNGWTGYDNLYEKQLAPDSMFLSETQRFCESAPLGIGEHDVPVGSENPLDDEHGFENHLGSTIFADSQEYNHRLRLEEDLKGYCGAHLLNKNPEFQRPCDGVSQINGFFPNIDERLEEVLSHPSHQIYERSRMDWARMSPLIQTHAHEKIRPLDHVLQEEPEEHPGQHEEEVHIQGFWKPNKLY